MISRSLTTRLLDAGLDGRARLLVVAAALVLAGVYIWPLWNMTMFAPQYPDGLRLDIYGYALVGGNNGQDVKEINVLNHYIGMRPLVAEDFTEFQWIPFIVGALGLLALRAAVLGRLGHLIDVIVLNVYFALFSLWTFAHKLWVYGHTLSPDAPVNVPGFMPPLFGFRQIANFEVYAYPGGASYALAASLLLLIVAAALTWRASRATAPATEAVGAAAAPAR